MGHCSELEHQLDTSMPISSEASEVYQGYVPPEMELSDLERRAYAMAKIAGEHAAAAAMNASEEQPPTQVISDEEYERLLAEPEDAWASLGGGVLTYRQTGQLPGKPTARLTVAQQNANERRAIAEHRRHTVRNRRGR